jgi:hypothetical protein
MRKLTISGQVRRNVDTVPNTTQIHSLHTFGDGEIQALSDVLIDCVKGGGLCDTKFFYRALKEPA